MMASSFIRINACVCIFVGSHKDPSAIWHLPREICLLFLFGVMVAKGTRPEPRSGSAAAKSSRGNSDICRLVDKELEADEENILVSIMVVERGSYSGCCPWMGRGLRTPFGNWVLLCMVIW